MARKSKNLERDYAVAARDLCAAMRDYDATLHRADALCQENMGSYLEDAELVLDRMRDRAEAQRLRKTLDMCGVVVAHFNDEVLEPRLEDFYKFYRKGAKNGRPWDTDSSYELNVFSYFPAKDEPTLGKIRRLAGRYREAAIDVSGELENSYRKLVVESATLPLTFREYATLGDSWHVIRAEIGAKIRGPAVPEKRSEAEFDIHAAAEKAQRSEYLLDTFPYLRAYINDATP